MKSFEQIAQAIYEAYETNRRFFRWESDWEILTDDEKAPWIAAAQTAHKEIMEVH